MVSTSRMSAPPSISAVACFGIGGPQLVEGDGAKAGIVHVRRERAVRLVGPIAPATKRGRPSRFCAAMRQSRAPAARQRGSVRRQALPSRNRPARSWSTKTCWSRRCRRRPENRRDEFPAIGIGLRQRQQVVVAAQIPLPVLEARAAKIRFVEAGAAASSCPSRRRAAGCARREARSGLQRTRLHGTAYPGIVSCRANETITRLPFPPGARRADGKSRRRGRRDSWCRSGIR